MPGKPRRKKTLAERVAQLETNLDGQQGMLSRLVADVIKLEAPRPVVASRAEVQDAVAVVLQAWLRRLLEDD